MFTETITLNQKYPEWVHYWFGLKRLKPLCLFEIIVNCVSIILSPSCFVLMYRKTTGFYQLNFLLCIAEQIVFYRSSLDIFFSCVWYIVCRDGLLDFFSSCILLIVFSYPMTVVSASSTEFKKNVNTGQQCLILGSSVVHSNWKNYKLELTWKIFKKN